jgi:hypothetical protein
MKVSIRQTVFLQSQQLWRRRDIDTQFLFGHVFEDSRQRGDNRSSGFIGRIIRLSRLPVIFVLFDELAHAKHLKLFGFCCGTKLKQKLVEKLDPVKLKSSKLKIEISHYLPRLNLSRVVNRNSTNVNRSFWAALAKNSDKVIQSLEISTPRPLNNRLEMVKSAYT